MAVETTVTLRHGLGRARTRHREAVVRALTGADEARLAELGPGASPAARATALIAATTAAIGKVAPVTEDDARGLTAGDRERLILSVYERTFAKPLEAVARCPAEGCGETLEFAFGVDEVLAEPPARAPGDDARTLEVPVEGTVLKVRFRLARGADQEAAARIAGRDPARAADVVLEGCVLGVEDGAGRAVTPVSVLADLRAPLAEAMARLDPEAETAVRAPCPACGADIVALIDAQSFVDNELSRPGGIFGEVDRLARTYHWAEADILALSVARRRRYLALAAGTA
ncbi:MAG TPA: hypothetical protein VGB88_08060 [Alphaproteobacteria bacterium]